MKGFIGPLEDVTIAIPIAVGLILFFSSVFYAFTKIDEMNREIELYKAAIELSYIGFEEASFDMQDQDFLDALCTRLEDQAQKSMVRFALIVKLEEVGGTERYFLCVEEHELPEKPNLALEFTAAFRPEDERFFYPCLVEVWVWK